jgi:hypothetical protein
MKEWLLVLKAADCGRPLPAADVERTSQNLAR